MLKITVLSRIRAGMLFSPTVVRMVGMSQTPKDAVSSAVAAKQQYESAVGEFHDDPAAAVGMSPEELDRRRKAAAKSRNVKIGDKSFEIQSHTRAQQIMQKGTSTMAYDKRMGELKAKMGILKQVRWVVIFAGLSIIYLMCYYLLLPRYIAHSERSRRMEARARERSAPSDRQS